MVVKLPRELDDSQVIYDAWTGAYGAKGKDFTKRRVDARTIAFDTDALRSGEGITVEVTMPGDAVSRPGWMSEAAAWLVDNFPYAIFPATLFACIAAWFYRGRDLPGKGTIVVNYEPPDGLSPAEVGTLIDERVDLRDISAVIIDLAARGYLTIKEIPSKSLVFVPRRLSVQARQGLRRPQAIRDGDPQHALQGQERGPHERAGDEVLPGDRQGEDRPLSGLEPGWLLRRQPQHGPRHVSRARPACCLRCALGASALVQIGMIGRVFIVPIAIAGVLSAIVVVITSRVMPRKTRKGRIAWEQINGLEEYIRRAEVDDIQAQDRRGVFERLLPYAIIFGLSNRWAKAFADLYTQPPDWYQPARPAQLLDVAVRERHRPLGLLDESLVAGDATLNRHERRPNGRGLCLVERRVFGRRLLGRRIRRRRGRVVVVGLAQARAGY